MGLLSYSHQHQHRLFISAVFLNTCLRPRIPSLYVDG